MGFWIDSTRKLSNIPFLEKMFSLFKVHMNRKFFLCSYKLSPLKYTIPKFETYWVKIGNVTGVQSYAILP